MVSLGDRKSKGKLLWSDPSSSGVWGVPKESNMELILEYDEHISDKSCEAVRIIDGKTMMTPEIQNMAYLPGTLLKQSCRKICT